MDYPIEIYGLYDPRDGALRYVGKANDSAKRLASHLRDARRRDTPVYRWIRKLADMGMKPTMRVMAHANADHWQTYERMLIADAKLEGEHLLNVAEGGDEPHCPLEVRVANAKRLNQRLKDDPLMARVKEVKRRVAMALRGGYMPEEAKAKLRIAAARAPHLFGEYASL